MQFPGAGSQLPGMQIQLQVSGNANTVTGYRVQGMQNSFRFPDASFQKMQILVQLSDTVCREEKLKTIASFECKSGNR